MIHYVLFDTETTGNTQEDRIIQIGAMIVAQNGAVESYDELCFSEVPIKLEAMEVHNITPDLIASKGDFKSTHFYQKLHTLNENSNYLIAHNIKFDLSMLEKEGFVNNMKIIDTLRCAKHLYNDSPYHRLQYLRYSLGLYKEEQSEAQKYNITIKAHDAIGDVLVMKLLLSKLVSLAKEKYPHLNPMEQLVTLSATPVMMKKFVFGKYVGLDIEDVASKDIGYIKWMVKTLELDEDMRFTLENMLERYR
ncbi:MAG: DNA polymerase III subunit epsilon [Sulfurovum sp. AS07-7]|nr:MAG: DNA polymerase III subunit epsilon [Sulfurovum sp. AS07-7]